MLHYIQNGSLQGDAIRERAEIIFEKTMAKNGEEKTLFSSFYEATNTLKQQQQKMTLQENYRPVSLMDTDVKPSTNISQPNLAT